MFWMPLMMMGAQAALGAAKNKRAQEIESSDRKLAAETQRYSPWTGMQANQIRHAGSALADIGGGALSGFMQGSAMQGLGGGGETPTFFAGGGGGGMQEQLQTMSPWEKMRTGMGQRTGSMLS